MSELIKKYYESAASLMDVSVESSGLMLSNATNENGEHIRVTVAGGKPLRIARFGEEANDIQIDNIEDTVVFHPLCEAISRDKDSQVMTFYKGLANTFLNVRIMELSEYLIKVCLEKKKISPTLSKKLEFMDGAKENILTDLKAIFKVHAPNVADKRFIHFTTKRKAEVEGKRYQCIAECIYPTLPDEDEPKHLFEAKLSSKAARSRLHKLFDLLMINLEDPSVHTVKTQQQVAPTWYAFTKAIGQLHEHLNDICLSLENLDDAPQAVDLTFMEMDDELKKFKGMISVSSLCQGTSDEIEAEVARLEDKRNGQQSAIGNKVQIASASRYTNPSNPNRTITRADQQPPVEQPQIVYQQPQQVVYTQPVQQPVYQQPVYQQPMQVHGNANDNLNAMVAMNEPQPYYVQHNQPVHGYQQRVNYRNPGASRGRGRANTMGAANAPIRNSNYDL